MLIIKILFIGLVFSACNIANHISKDTVIIKYYSNLEDSINYWNYNSRHVYEKNISKSEALESIQFYIKHGVSDPDIAVYKVYFKNEYTFLKKIPFKSEKYNGNKTPSNIYFYNNKGRLKKSYLITDRGTRYITKYLYNNQEMISETIFINGSKEKMIYKYKNNILYEVAKFHNDKLQNIDTFVLKEGRLIEIKL
jgi:hypothetical protein